MSKHVCLSCVTTIQYTKHDIYIASKKDFYLLYLHLLFETLVGKKLIIIIFSIISTYYLGTYVQKLYLLAVYILLVYIYNDSMPLW